MDKRSALIVMIVCMCIVYFERSLPWILFGKREMPASLRKLADLLPAALMATLVVYGLKSLPSADSHTALSLMIASGITVVLHLWKKNTILSVFLGTACYIIILNYF